MLESVVVARDRFLKPGGVILPAEARVYVTPFTNDFFVLRSAFWRNVYGFDFSPIM
jgi:protein arginine N-methyltransferase 6